MSYRLFGAFAAQDSLSVTRHARVLTLYISGLPQRHVLTLYISGLPQRHAPSASLSVTLPQRHVLTLYISIQVALRPGRHRTLLSTALACLFFALFEIFCRKNCGFLSSPET